MLDLKLVLNSLLLSILLHFSKQFKALKNNYTFKLDIIKNHGLIFLNIKIP